MSGSFWPNGDQERAQLAAKMFAKSSKVNGVIILSKSTLVTIYVLSDAGILFLYLSSSCPWTAKINEKELIRTTNSKYKNTNQDLLVKTMIIVNPRLASPT